ncbi:restriction endonuclease subunit S [Candidatus Accumulibacter sp. ACC003]|uniref:restriction endonuclease subunit S n=1 Tax=Candidatus Accumulibacter sp. ACC003 TaxID=2823334 RepID=UPI0025C2D78C|nr:restriction endonuclease subunit S [Candidatus Accumulibacter sp. ACC003]
MIADLKPYAEYKESGLPWLGQVPASWQLRRAKFLFREVDERSKTGKEEVLSVSHKTGVTPRSQKTVTMFLAESNVGHKICRPQDLVINTLWAWMAALGVSMNTGIVSPAYGVYRPLTPGQLLPRFADLLLRTSIYAAEYQRRSTGVSSSRLRLYPEDFLRIPVLFPSAEEQAVILRFLDWATGRLERAIRAKRKVIALLNEQKQAIIHRAVTRGLDPSVPLKPSGIPWLGDIPQHWVVRRLRTLVHDIDQGVSPLAVGFLAEGNSWGVLKSGCVNRGVFRETEHKQLARGFEIDPDIVVKVGDVLISRACGSPKLVGSVGRVKSLRHQLILSDKTFRARFRGSVNVDFMVFAMNCVYYRHQVERAISGAEGMANNLPLSALRNFTFAVPPTNEATAISGYVESETAELQTVTARLEREIQLLREYRTRLVADVVTGKLDVREAAARLPDEAPLDIAEDDDALTDEAEVADEELTE